MLETLDDWFPQKPEKFPRLQHYFSEVLETQKLHLLENSSTFLRYWFMGLLTSIPSLNLTSEKWLVSYAQFDASHLSYIMAFNDSKNKDILVKSIHVNLAPVPAQKMAQRGEQTAHIMLDMKMTFEKNYSSSGTYFPVHKLTIDVLKPENSAAGKKSIGQPYTVKVQTQYGAHKLPSVVDQNMLEKYTIYCRLCPEKYKARLPLGTLNLDQFSQQNRTRQQRRFLQKLSSFSIHSRRVLNISQPAEMVVFSTMAILAVHLGSKFDLRVRASVDTRGRFEYAFFESQHELFQPFFLHLQVDKRPWARLNPKPLQANYSNSPFYASIGVTCHENECMWQFEQNHVTDDQKMQFVAWLKKFLLNLYADKDAEPIVGNLREQFYFHQDYNWAQFTANLLGKHLGYGQFSSHKIKVVKYESDRLNQQVDTFILIYGPAIAVLKIHDCDTTAEKFYSLPDLSLFGQEFVAVINIGCTDLADKALPQVKNFHSTRLIRNASVILTHVNENTLKLFQTKRMRTITVAQHLFVTFDVLRELHWHPNFLFEAHLSYLILMNSWKQANIVEKFKMARTLINSFLCELSHGQNFDKLDALSFWVKNVNLLVRLRPVDGQTMDQVIDSYLADRQRLVKKLAAKKMPVCASYIELGLKLTGKYPQISSMCKMQFNPDKETNETVAVATCMMAGENGTEGMPVYLDVHQERIIHVSHYKKLMLTMAGDRKRETVCAKQIREARETKPVTFFNTDSMMLGEVYTRKHPIITKLVRVVKRRFLGNNVFYKMVSVLEKSGICVIVYNRLDRLNETSCKPGQFKLGIFENDQSLTIDAEHHGQGLQPVYATNFSAVAQLLNYIGEKPEKPAFTMDMLKKPQTPTEEVEFGEEREMTEGQNQIRQSAVANMEHLLSSPKNKNFKYLTGPDYEAVPQCQKRLQYVPKIRWYNFFSVPVMAYERIQNNFEVTKCELTPGEKQFKYGQLDKQIKQHIDFEPKLADEKRTQIVGMEPVDELRSNGPKTRPSIEVGGLIVLEANTTKVKRKQSLALLSAGQNLVNGFRNTDNVFVMTSGQKLIQGGNTQDTFILEGDQVVTGFLNGNNGTNSLLFPNYLPKVQSALNINVMKGRLMQLSVPDNKTLLVANIDEILGRLNLPDTVTGQCGPKQVNLNGGNQDIWDHIHFNNTRCKHDVSVNLRTYTSVHHSKTSGTFGYLLEDGPSRLTLDPDRKNRALAEHVVYVKYDLINFAMVYSQNKTNATKDPQHNLEFFLKPFDKTICFFKVTNIDKTVTLVFSDGYVVKYDAMNLLQKYMPDFYRQDLTKHYTTNLNDMSNVEVLVDDAERIFIDLKRPRPTQNVQYDFFIGSKLPESVKHRHYVVNLDPANYLPDEPSKTINMSMSPHLETRRTILVDFSPTLRSFSVKNQVKLVLKAQNAGRHVLLDLHDGSKLNRKLASLLVKEVNILDRIESLLVRLDALHQLRRLGSELVLVQQAGDVDVLVLTRQDVLGSSRHFAVARKNLDARQGLSVVYSASLVTVFPCRRWFLQETPNSDRPQCAQTSLIALNYENNEPLFDAVRLEFGRR